MISSELQTPKNSIKQETGLDCEEVEALCNSMSMDLIAQLKRLKSQWFVHNISAYNRSKLVWLKRHTCLPDDCLKATRIEIYYAITICRLQCL